MNNQLTRTAEPSPSLSLGWMVLRAFMTWIEMVCDLVRRSEHLSTTPTSVALPVTGSHHGETPADPCTGINTATTSPTVPA